MDEKIHSVIPVNPNKLYFHEQHEPKRLEKVKQKITEEDLINNPILVTNVDQDSKYLVLDGVHRAFALKKIGVKYVPVQVVNESDICVSTWKHKIHSPDFINEIKNKDDFLVVTNPKNVNLKLLSKVYSKGSVYYIFSKREYLDDWIKLISLYNKGTVQRIGISDEVILGSDELLFTFPEISVRDIIDNSVYQNKIFPSGITKVKVSNRFLNMAIPITLLRRESIENEWNTLINNRKKRLRRYEEPIIICES